MRKVAPCKECKERYKGCHDKCSKYKEFKSTIAFIRDKRNKYNKEQEDIIISIRRSKG